MNDRRYQEILGTIIILFSLILTFSLFSFRINDFELLTQNRSVYNIMGPLGAYISYYLRGVFGYSSSFLMIIFAISGWSILRKGEIADMLERIFSLFFLMITSSILVSMISNSSIPYYSGGYIGLYLFKLLDSLFGRFGSYIITLFLNLIGFILLGIVSLSSILKHTEKSGGKYFVLLKDLLKSVFSHRKSNRMPINLIDREIERIYSRIPWIVKKRFRIGDDQASEVMTKLGLPKLLEMKEPVPLRTDPIERDEKMAYESGGLFGDVNNSLFSTSLSLSENLNEGIELDDIPTNDSSVIDQSAVSLNEEDAIHYWEGQEQGISDEEDADDILDGITTNRIGYCELDSDIDSAVLVGERVESTLKRASPDDGMLDDDSCGLYDLEKGRSAVSGEKIIRVFDSISINGEYSVPTSFLNTSRPIDIEGWKSEVKKSSELLINTLREFGIESRVINVQRGPVITLYEMQIAPGIKVNRIVGLSDDIAMALAAFRVRIVAPIPGKSAIGVEVPNRNREMVTLGDVIKQPEYRSATGKLKIVLGKDILGKPILLDLQKLPHLLIAGATGSGKSVCVNSIISGLIYNYDPNHVRFILIDPKMVELQLYNGLPHLISPVITEAHVAPKVLKWAVYEMERRYRILSELNTRDIEKYNDKIKMYGDQFERLPYIVIIMDELADLMMIAAKEIEGSIIRIAQKARAVGMHLVLATQRPSVDIITGIIKANFPARIAFQVAQKTDSRTIIDQNGAEKLLGKGDMLYQSPINSFPIRIQGTFISEEEIIKMVNHLNKMSKPSYVDIEDSIYDEDGIADDETVEDKLFIEALRIVEETKKASASYLQRRLSIGYNRAARIIELMEDRGYIGPQQGSKPREVYV
ncbi:MAG: DNA translocase FtsK [Spirochaetota bacterium]|nr:DNA translocase FtsK [Spirochaetota bacterium]